MTLDKAQRINELLKIYFHLFEDDTPVVWTQAQEALAFEINEIYTEPDA